MSSTSKPCPAASHPVRSGVARPVVTDQQDPAVAEEGCAPCGPVSGPGVPCSRKTGLPPRRLYSSTDRQRGPLPAAPLIARQGATRLLPEAGDRVNEPGNRLNSADQKPYELLRVVPGQTSARLRHGFLLLACPAAGWFPPGTGTADPARARIVCTFCATWIPVLVPPGRILQAARRLDRGSKFSDDKL